MEIGREEISARKTLSLSPSFVLQHDSFSRGRWKTRTGKKGLGAQPWVSKRRLCTEREKERVVEEGEKSFRIISDDDAAESLHVRCPQCCSFECTLFAEPKEGEGSCTHAIKRGVRKTENHVWCVCVYAGPLKTTEN